MSQPVFSHSDAELVNEYAVGTNSRLGSCWWLFALLLPAFSITCSDGTDGSGEINGSSSCPIGCPVDFSCVEDVGCMQNCSVDLDCSVGCCVGLVGGGGACSTDPQRCDVASDIDEQARPVATVVGTSLTHIAEQSMGGRTSTEFEVVYSLVAFDSGGVPIENPNEVHVELSSGNISHGSNGQSRLTWSHGAECVPTTIAAPGTTTVVALLMDQSGSITDNDPNDIRIPAAKEFLNALSAQDSSAVFSFASAGTCGEGDLLSWGQFTSNHSTWSPVLDHMATCEEGGTPLYHAISVLASGFPQSPTGATRAMLVFTDGENTDGSQTIADAVAAARQSGIRLYTVGLSNSVDTQALLLLSVDTGGAMFSASDIGPLISAFRGLPRLLTDATAGLSCSQRLVVDSPAGLDVGRVFSPLAVTVGGDRSTAWLTLDIDGSHTVEPVCGDGVCSTSEHCSEDCGPQCGDFVCDPGETCSEDCGYCGDGDCDPQTENSFVCSSDCPRPSGYYDGAMTERGRAVFFRDGIAYSYSYDEDRLDGIFGLDFVPAHISAGLVHPNSSQIYLFSGDKYYRLATFEGPVDEIGTIGVDAWPGVPTGVDAAIPHPNGKAYFFRGDKYYRFSYSANGVDKIGTIGADGGWTGLPSDLDAALLHTNGKAYFFKNESYYRFSFSSDSVDKVGVMGVDGWPGM